MFVTKSLSPKSPPTTLEPGRGKAFPPASVPSLPLPHSSGDTPQRPDAGSRRNSSRPNGRNRRYGAWVPLRDRRSLRGRRLRLPCSRRLRRFVARARPFGGIAFLRKLRTRHRRLAALQPAPTPPALSCGCSAPRRVLRAGSARSTIFGAQSPRGCGARSRCTTRTFVVSEACPLRVAS